MAANACRPSFVSAQRDTEFSELFASEKCLCDWCVEHLSVLGHHHENAVALQSVLLDSEKDGTEVATYAVFQHDTFWRFDEAP